MARDCPQNQSAGKGYPDQNGGYGRGGIRALHGLTEVMPEGNALERGGKKRGIYRTSMQSAPVF